MRRAPLLVLPLVAMLLFVAATPALARPLRSGSDREAGVWPTRHGLQCSGRTSGPRAISPSPGMARAVRKVFLRGHGFVRLTRS